MSNIRDAYLIKLGKILARIYPSDAEIRALCSDFGVNYNTELPAEGHREKALELVRCIADRGRIDELVMRGKVSHPEYFWDDEPGIKYYVVSTLDFPERSKKIYVEHTAFEETERLEEAKCIILDLDNLPSHWFTRLINRKIDFLVFLSYSDITGQPDVRMNAATVIHNLGKTFSPEQYHYCKNESDLITIMKNINAIARLEELSYKIAPHAN